MCTGCGRGGLICGEVLWGGELTDRMPITTYTTREWGCHEFFVFCSLWLSPKNSTALEISFPMTTASKTPKITVLIPCKNERMNIRACIESVRGFADEILVADSGSTDGTMEIVRQIGDCRLIEREYITSGDFKNWAIPQASHEWVFLIDSDERITPELTEEILATVQSPDACDGYWVFRDNHFMGHPIKHCGWNHDVVNRLFRRDMARYEGPSDHGEVVISSGNVGTLNNRMLHYTYWSYDQAFQKFQRYTSLQAQQWYDQGRKPSYFQLVTRGPFRFFRDYFLLLGFLDGIPGFQISALAGFYSYMKQARLWELYYAKKQPDSDANLAEKERSAAKAA